MAHRHIIISNVKMIQRGVFLLDERYAKLKATIENEILPEIKRIYLNCNFIFQE
jgi:hypothetical protein